MNQPPPDITVTRADVLANPLEHQNDRPQPDDAPLPGRSWHLVRFGPEDVDGVAHLAGRLVWVDLPAGLPLSERATVAAVMAHPGACALTREGARNARAAFLWQTALASDAALADISHDAPETPVVSDATRTAVKAEILRQAIHDATRRG